MDANAFNVQPATDGKLTQDGTFTVANYGEMVGKKMRLSQDGGSTWFYSEIKDVQPTGKAADRYCPAFMAEVGIGNAIQGVWYPLNGTIPSGLPAAEQPRTSNDLAMKYWVWDAVWAHDWAWVAHWQYHTPQDGDVIVVRPYGARTTDSWLRFNSALSSWETITPAVSQPYRILFSAELGALSQQDSLLAEVVTNMDAVYADLGFEPKVYLAEAFQRSVSSEVKRLFDVIHHMYCECPPDSPAVVNPSNPVAAQCTPFGIAQHIPSPYRTSKGADCHESLNEISWSDWAKSYYYERFQDWTRCGQLYPVLSKDGWSQGDYNRLLDVSEFTRVTAAGPWRLGAPSKGEAGEQWVTESRMHHRIGGISERWFYQTLMRNVIIELRSIAKRKAQGVNANFYTTDRQVFELFRQEFGSDGSSFNLNNIKEQVANLLGSSAYIEDVDAQSNVESFIASKSFRGLMLKLHNGITQAIRSGMLDQYGNIVNYSLRNEIVQVSSSLEFRYG